MLRYTPGGNGAETAGITYRAWDTTTGLNGELRRHIAAQFDRRAPRRSAPSWTPHRSRSCLATTRPRISLCPTRSRPKTNRPGTLIGKLITTDPNAGNTFTYSLVGGAGSADNASFAISGDAPRIRRDLRFRDQERLPNSGPHDGPRRIVVRKSMDDLGERRSGSFLGRSGRLDRRGIDLEARRRRKTASLSQRNRNRCGPAPKSELRHEHQPPRPRRGR